MTPRYATFEDEDHSWCVVTVPDGDYVAWPEMTPADADRLVAILNTPPLYTFEHDHFAKIAAEMDRAEALAALRALTIAVGDYKYLVSPRDGQGTCTVCHATEGIGHDPTFACGKLGEAYETALRLIRDVPEPPATDR